MKHKCPRVSSNPGGTISGQGEAVGKSKTIQRGTQPYKFKKLNTDKSKKAKMQKCNKQEFGTRICTVTL